MVYILNVMPYCKNSHYRYWLIGNSKLKLFFLYLLIVLIAGCAPVKPRPENGESALTNSTAIQKATDFLKDLGLAAMAQGNYAKAIADFTRAVKINPKDPIVWKYLGEAYMAAKFYPQAEKAFNKALSLKPDYGEVMFDLGLLYEQWGKYDEAIKWLKKAAYLPTYEERYLAFYELAQVYKKLGDEQNYLKNLNIAVNLYPRFKKALLELADYYAKQGNVDKAYLYYAQYLSYYPTDWNIALKFARFLIEHNRFSEAKALLKEIVNQSQDPQVVQKAYKLINELLIKEAQMKFKNKNNK